MGVVYTWTSYSLSSHLTSNFQLLWLHSLSAFPQCIFMVFSLPPPPSILIIFYVLFTAWLLLIFSFFFSERKYKAIREIMSTFQNANAFCLTFSQKKSGNCRELCSVEIWSCISCFSTFRSSSNIWDSVFKLMIFG